MRLLGVDKVLEEVGDSGVVVGVLALETGDEVLQGDAGDVAKVGGTDALDGVLVEEEVEPWHLTDCGEAGEGQECLCHEV